MYKLLIVEDEEIIRWGLKNEIPWSEFGFEVIGEADNGKIALELIPVLNPDAILLDIMMPMMNGIEFMSQINLINPKVKIVILSGHNEFEYARQGIDYGVFSYLLKPTKLNEIREVFKKLRIELERISNVNSELENLKKKSDPEINISEHNHTNISYSISSNDESDSVIQKVKKYINDNYSEKITLEILADMVYMNPSYFSVFFKQKTGYNYKDYHTMLRMEKAKELLTNTDLKIYEIASMTGYDDFRYFCRLFKKVTGLNTTHFRHHT